MSIPSRSTLVALTVALSLMPVASTAAQAPMSMKRERGNAIPLNKAAVEFQEMVSISGSLEFVLWGVTDLTDVQRDSVEQIEQGLRNTILRHATPISRARPLTPWWSAEQILFERPLNAIIAAKQDATDRLCNLLTPDQRRIVERNNLALRDFDEWYWQRIAMGAFSLSTLPGATAP